MNGSEHYGLEPHSLAPLNSGVDAPHHGSALEALSQSLATAHVANGMDPLDAALQAQLEAPLVHPLLS